MDFNGIFSVWKECWGWLSMDDVKKMTLISINNFVQSTKDLLSTQFYFFVFVLFFLWVDFFTHYLNCLSTSNVFGVCNGGSFLINIFFRFEKNAPGLGWLFTAAFFFILTLHFYSYYLVAARPSRERKDRAHFEKMLYGRRFKLLLGALLFSIVGAFLSQYVSPAIILLTFGALPLLAFLCFFYLDQDSSFSSFGLAVKNSVVMCLYFLPYLAVLGLVAVCAWTCAWLCFVLATYGFLAIYGFFYQLGFNPVVIVGAMGMIEKYFLAVCVVGFIAASLCFFTSFAATLYTRLKYSHFSLFTNEQS